MIKKRLLKSLLCIFICLNFIILDNVENVSATTIINNTAMSKVVTDMNQFFRVRNQSQFLAAHGSINGNEIVMSSIDSTTDFGAATRYGAGGAAQLCLLESTLVNRKNLLDASWHIDGDVYLAQNKKGFRNSISFIFGGYRFTLGYADGISMDTLRNLQISIYNLDSGVNYDMEWAVPTSQMEGNLSLDYDARTKIVTFSCLGQTHRASLVNLPGVSDDAIAQPSPGYEHQHTSRSISVWGALGWIEDSSWMAAGAAKPTNGDRVRFVFNQFYYKDLNPEIEEVNVYRRDSEGNLDTTSPVKTVRPGENIWVRMKVKNNPVEDPDIVFPSRIYLIPETFETSFVIDGIDYSSKNCEIVPGTIYIEETGGERTPGGTITDTSGIPVELKKDSTYIEFQIRVPTDIPLGTNQIKIGNRLQEQTLFTECYSVCSLDASVEDPDVFWKSYPVYTNVEIDRDENGYTKITDGHYTFTPTGSSTYCQDSFVQVEGKLENPRAETEQLTLKLDNEELGFDYSNIQSFYCEITQYQDPDTGELSATVNGSISVSPSGSDTTVDIASTGTYLSNVYNSYLGNKNRGVVFTIAPYSAVYYRYYIPVAQDSNGKPVANDTEDDTNYPIYNLVTIVEGWYGNKEGELGYTENPGYDIGWTSDSADLPEGNFGDVPICILDCDLSIENTSYILGRGAKIDFSSDTPYTGKDLTGYVLTDLENTKYNNDGSKNLTGVILPTKDVQEKYDSYKTLLQELGINYYPSKIKSGEIIGQCDTTLTSGNYADLGLDSTTDNAGTITDTPNDGRTYKFSIKYNSTMAKAQSNGTYYKHYTRSVIPNSANLASVASKRERSNSDIVITIKGPITCPLTLEYSNRQYKITYSKGAAVSGEITSLNSEEIIKSLSGDTVFDGHYLQKDGDTLYIYAGLFDMKLGTSNLDHKTKSDDIYIDEEAHELIIPQTTAAALNSDESITKIVFSPYYNDNNQSNNTYKTNDKFKVTMQSSNLSNKYVEFSNAEGISLLGQCMFSQIKFGKDIGDITIGDYPSANGATARISNIKVIPTSPDATRAIFWNDEYNYDSNYNDGQIVDDNTDKYQKVKSLELSLYSASNSTTNLYLIKSDEAETNKDIADNDNDNDTNEIVNLQPGENYKRFTPNNYIDQINLPANNKIGAFIWSNTNETVDSHLYICNYRPSSTTTINNNAKYYVRGTALSNNDDILEEKDDDGKIIHSILGIDDTYSYSNRYGVEVSLDGIGEAVTPVGDNFIGRYQALRYPMVMEHLSVAIPLNTNTSSDNFPTDSGKEEEDIIGADTVEFLLEYNGTSESRGRSRLISKPAVIENYSYTAGDVLLSSIISDAKDYYPEQAQNNLNEAMDPNTENAINYSSNLPGTLKEFDKVTNQLNCWYMGIDKQTTDGKPKNEDNAYVENDYILKNYSQVQSVSNTIGIAKPLIGLEIVARECDYENNSSANQLLRNILDATTESFIEADSYDNPETSIGKLLTFTTNITRGTENLTGRIRLDEYNTSTLEKWFTMASGTTITDTNKLSTETVGNIRPSVILLMLEKPYINNSYVEDYYQYPYDYVSNTSLVGRHKMTLQFGIVHNANMS